MTPGFRPRSRAVNMAHSDLAEGTGEPRPPLRDGSGFLNIQHTAGSIALSLATRRRTKLRPCSQAGFSPGWLGSATEGRRPQVPGLRLGARWRCQLDPSYPPPPPLRLNRLPRSWEKALPPPPPPQKQTKPPFHDPWESLCQGLFHNQALHAWLGQHAPGELGLARGLGPCGVASLHHSHAVAIKSPRITKGDLVYRCWNFAV